MDVRRPSLVATLAIALAVPASAHAATAHVEIRTLPPSDPKTNCCERTISTVFYDASTGEANRVALERRFTGSSTEIVITDAGNTIAPGFGCSSDGPDRVRCQGPGETGGVTATAGDGDDAFDPGDVSLDVKLGPGNDRAVAAGLLGARGEAGDDVLTCGDAPYGTCVLDGGAGSDQLTSASRFSRLTGGPGSDRVVGGPGSDEILDGGDEVDHDVLDGGSGGDDKLSYEQDSGGVRVNLKTSEPSGRPGEDDVISGFENAAGGSGPDVLIGDDNKNSLGGNKGRDILTGGGGDDVLGGGPGIVKDDRRNRLTAGPGNDTLIAGDRGDVMDAGPGNDDLRGGRGDDRLLGGPGADGLEGDAGRDRYDSGSGPDYLQTSGRRNEHERVTCGRGRDQVVDPGPGNVIEGSCEIIGWLPEFVFGPRRVRGHTAIVQFKCSTYTANDSHCKGRFRLLFHRRVVARARYFLKRGDWRLFRMRLARGALRELRRRGRLKVTVRARSIKRYGRASFGLELRR